MPLGYFTDSTPLTPIRDPFNVLVDGINNVEGTASSALSNFAATREIQTFRWADATERSSQTGMVAGDMGYQVDTGVAYRYSGSAWLAWSSGWINYTSTLSGFSVGSGGGALTSTRYRYQHGRVRVSFNFVFGSSGTSMTNTATFTLPFPGVPRPHPNSIYAGGMGTMHDASSGISRLAAALSNGASVTDVRLFYLDNVAGLFGTLAPGSPWTWAVGDAIQGELVYDPA